MRTPSQTRQKTKSSAGGAAKPAVDRVLARVARGVDALKQGRPVRLEEGWTMLAAETLDEAALARAMDCRAAPVLVLTHARAETLKIRLYTADVVALPLHGGVRAPDVMALADPTADLATPLKGPFETVREALPASFAAAAKLAKLAGLLPAAVLFESETRALKVGLSDILSYDRLAAENTRLIVQAHVPLEGAETAVLAAFRAGCGGPEHFALIIGHPSSGAPVLTRLHSECFTGDLLGSLKCDCGQQLRGAIAAIAKAGGGVLLYLAQEGRGIGIVNKLRAYRLQDQGFDTIEANERLGFEADERLYLVAARMLTLLGFSAVRLMTNNPDKVAALTAAGVNVVERVPHAFPSNPHNEAYLHTKAVKAGHWL